MGERLNLEIVKNGEVLANSYYHWSGFSESAARLASRIVNDFEYVKDYRLNSEVNNKDVLFAIRLLEQTGAGFPERDMEEVMKMLENPDLKLRKCISRNDGIIGATEEQIKETENWAEETVTIDIEKKTIDFHRAVGDITKEEILNDCEVLEEEIGKENINFKEIQFEDIFYLKTRIELANYKREMYFYNEFDKQYYYWIG